MITKMKKKSVHQKKHSNFLQYMWRNTQKRDQGIGLHLIAAAFAIFAWPLGAFVLLVPATFWLGAWFNWTGKWV